MQMKSLAFAAASIASFILVPVGAASAEDGVSADTIVFGQACRFDRSRRGARPRQEDRHECRL